jgi:hypothetical protein
LAEVLDPDYVQVIPQSGEIVRGVGNFEEMMRNWPSGGNRLPGAVKAEVVTTVDYELITAGVGPFPTFNLVRVEGEGDTLTFYALIRYPDEQVWFDVSIVTLQGGKIVKELSFFGPMFEAPEWRSRWAKVMTPEEQRELVGFTTESLSTQ